MTEAGTGTNPAAGDELGAALTHGDYDNDGVTELVVGAPGDVVGSQPSGSLLVYSNPEAPSFITRVTQEGAVAASEAGDRFGASLTTGDFDGDGYDDLVAGAPNEAPASDPAGGTIFVFPGGSGGLGSGSFLTQSSIGDPTETGDKFGASLAAGDFNDDGADDLAVGLPGEAPAGNPAGGAVAIFAGGPSGLGSGQMILQTAVGDPVEADDEFGASLAVGDLNGDGIDDLAMGAPGEAPGGNPAGGAIVVLLGAASGLPTGSFHTQASGGGVVEAGDRFGAALAAGDIDADGHDDLVVGAPNEAPGFQPAGGGFSVLPGASGGLGTGYFVAQDAVGDPIEAGDGFGEQLAVGDLDGDGDADVVAGSPGEKSGVGPVAGAVAHLPGGATLATGRLATPEQLGHDGSAAGRFGEALDIVRSAPTGGPGSVLAGSPGDASATGALNLARGWTDQSSLGPLVGGVSETTAKLWLRTATPTTAQVEYRAAGSGTWLQSPASDTTTATDLTTVIELTGLPQDTEIEYRLVLACATDVLASGRFRTLPDPDAPSVVRFTYGADINPSYDLSIMDRAREEAPNFMLLGGDQIYADVAPQAPDTKAGYEAKYRTTWGHNEFRRPTASMPTLMMWDDHEIWNDWSAGTTGRYTNARTAFDEYQGSHNPAPAQPRELYFTYRAGGAEMFVLDTRTYRSPNSLDPSDATKTMLGPDQLADLKTWLETSTAPFKIIVSSVPWGDYGTTGNDSWRGFLAERNDIMNHIGGNEIPGVLVLSGDQHWSGAFRLDDIDNMNLYEFMPTPLATNNRTAPDIAANPEVLHVSDDERVFALFEVDTTVSPAAIRISYITSTGQEIFQTEIAQTDINP